tara:strand:+ start:1401 stop:1880 length:480 start_codon:yes stop_codon:yes gene_type:complete
MKIEYNIPNNTTQYTTPDLTMTTNSPSMSPTSATSIGYLERSSDTPCDRIKNFIDDIGNIMSEIDNEHLVKFLKTCSHRAYNFRNQEPMPSLADCMNTMIRDQNTLDPNSKYYHYYNAMIMEFLQRSMTLINAEQDAIDNLNPKINQSLEKFKEFYETV